MSTVSDPASALGAPPTVLVAPRRGWVRPVQVSAVFAGWLGVVVIANSLHPIAALRPYALFAHLIFLAVSFGAVLAVELQGLALLFRLTSVGRMIHIAAGLDPLIWLGLAGMCASGVVLGPHLDRPLTVVKLLAVLAVALNGLWARDMVHRLRALPPNLDARFVPRDLLRRGARVSLVSQLGWWGAVVIGFLTTNG